MILTPSVPVAYSGIMTIPNVFVQNAMASLVYRQLKMGYLDGKKPSRSDPEPATGPIAFNLSSLTTSSRLSVSRAKEADFADTRGSAHDHDDEGAGTQRSTEGGAWKPNAMV